MSVQLGGILPPLSLSPFPASQLCSPEDSRMLVLVMKQMLPIASARNYTTMISSVKLRSSTGSSFHPQIFGYESMRVSRLAPARSRPCGCLQLRCPAV
jgi:hypothetical protein